MPMGERLRARMARERDQHREKFIFETGVNSYTQLVKAGAQHDIQQVSFYEHRLIASLNLLGMLFWKTPPSSSMKTDTGEFDPKATEAFFNAFLAGKDHWAEKIVTEVKKREKVSAQEIADAREFRHKAGFPDLDAAGIEDEKKILDQASRYAWVEQKRAIWSYGLHDIPLDTEE